MTVIDKTPRQPGCYWAMWEKAEQGTRDRDELIKLERWIAVDVVDCPYPEADADKLRVFVPGVERSQSLSGFLWGDPVVTMEEARALDQMILNIDTGVQHMIESMAQILKNVGITK